MKDIVSALLLTTALLILPSLAFAISTASGSGTLSIDWDQDSGAFVWEAGAYGMNGADAIWGTENYTTDNDGNRIYDHHVSVYDGGWVDSLGDVVDTSSATIEDSGSSAAGEATTTTSGVSSFVQITNNGTGSTLSASGTSHLVRHFTISTTDSFVFDEMYVDAEYSFIDSGVFDAASTEVIDWGHHVKLTLTYLSNEWVKLDEDSIAYDMKNPLSAAGFLSVIDPDGWQTDRSYSIELHTYNSAMAYSPAAPVPEPGSLLLLGSGLAGLALYRRRMNKA